MKKHVIRNAHDSWWFLYNHPKFSVPTRTEIPPEYVEGLKEIEGLKGAGVELFTEASGKSYRMWPQVPIHALHCNLDIFYTKVNARRRVDKDKAKNTNVECWLEFGPIQYGYAYSCTDTPMDEYDTETILHHIHDINLDTGAPTFDEALVKLARLVKKHYGDY